MKILNVANKFLNGKKTLIGFVLIGVGYVVDSDEVKGLGMGLAGVGGAHKAKKAYDKKKTNKPKEK